MWLCGCERRMRRTKPQDSSSAMLYALQPAHLPRRRRGYFTCLRSVAYRVLRCVRELIVTDAAKVPEQSNEQDRGDGEVGGLNLESERSAR